MGAPLYELFAREQVDDLPRAGITKTIAKRARVGPHTQIVLTVEKSFSRKITSTSGLRSPIISLVCVLKFWLELIT